MAFLKVLRTGVRLPSSPPILRPLKLRFQAAFFCRQLKALTTFVKMRRMSQCQQPKVVEQANLLFCIMLTFSFISKGSSSVYKSINSITIGEGANLSLLLRMHLYLGEIIVRIYAKLYSMIRIRVFFVVDSLGDVHRE